MQRNISTNVRNAKNAAQKAYQNYVKPVCATAGRCSNTATAFVADIGASLGTASVKLVTTGHAYIDGKLYTATSETERIKCTVSERISSKWEETKVKFKNSVEKVSASLDQLKQEAVEKFTKIKENISSYVKKIDWARIGKGILVIAGAAVIIFVGGIAVAATGGAALAALPAIAGGTASFGLWVTLGTFVAGTATIGFGSSDLVEGGQDIYYGLTGNQEATSWNVIRDTAFQGHEEEYYLVEALISQGAATGTQLVESMGYAETARMEGAAAKNQGSTESHEYSQFGTVEDGRGEEYEKFLKEGSKEGLTYTNLDDGLNFSNRALEHMGESGCQVITRCN